ncbi:MAG: HupE/UreJ family protein [Gemmatimonadaceae bacterium]|nr:HupE/UreJ family protein [Gemmatimonadaceae bacterium]
MFSEFATYLRLGIDHIADLQGYDHIAFVVALTAGYRSREWRRLLVLVTAFTAGHSLTLLLATLDVVHATPRVVEPLIASTILVTGTRGLLAAVSEQSGRPSTAPAPAPAMGAPWLMAAFFGLIHGLGFSNFLRTVLGTEERLVVPLLGFNLGLEVGQLAIVAAALALSVVAERVGVRRRWWTIALSLAAALVGLQMLVTRLR